MDTKQELALKNYDSAFNCAQSVVSVFCEDYGVEQETALKMAGGLGGGIRSGNVCGAVSGAVMIIGLKYGQYIADDTASKQNCNAKTVEFLNEFKKRNRTIICRELLGCDISTTDGFERAQAQNLFKSKCKHLIKCSVALLEKLGY